MTARAVRWPDAPRRAPLASAAQSAPRHATVVYAVGANRRCRFRSSRELRPRTKTSPTSSSCTWRSSSRARRSPATTPWPRRWRRAGTASTRSRWCSTSIRRARWQDGTPVSAHDVVYTWQLANKMATDQSRLEPIASVDAVDQWTVRVRFKRPFAGAALHLRVPDAAVAGTPAGATRRPTPSRRRSLRSIRSETGRSASIAGWPDSWSNCAPTRRSSWAGRRSTG